MYMLLLALIVADIFCTSNPCEVVVIQSVQELRRRTNRRRCPNVQTAGPYTHQRRKRDAFTDVCTAVPRLAVFEKAAWLVPGYWHLV